MRILNGSNWNVQYFKIALLSMVKYQSFNDIKKIMRIWNGSIWNFKGFKSALFSINKYKSFNENN